MREQTRRGGNSRMVSRLFFRLLPVQAAIVAMGSVNSIVDGMAAARFIGVSAVGVVGLYYTVVRVLEAAGSVLLGGVSVLGGKHLGSGQVDKTRGVITLGMAAAVLFGAVLTVLSLALPGPMASLLGADESLREPLSAYILGYAAGIVPQLLAGQAASALQLERREDLGRLGIAVMILSNALLDVLFVRVLNLGVWGLALATSLANWAYLLVLLLHYASPGAQLRPKLSLADPRELLPLLRTGFPGGLLIACLAARNLAISRILLSAAGSGGLSAMSSFNMVCGLLISISIGTGSLVRMLSSIFLGEDNREGLLSVIRVSLAGTLPILAGIGAAVILLSPALAAAFFPDRTSEVWRMTRELFFIYGFCVPFTLPCLVCSSYFQAAGHRLFMNLISLVDGFFSMVVPAALLAPALGALGVWLSFPLGFLITLAVSLLYPVIRLRRLPRNPGEWLLLPPDFGEGNSLVLILRRAGDVVRTAEKVQSFCESDGISPRVAAHAGLCLEEIAGNIVRHGFSADRKQHMVEVRVSIRPDGVLLRVKDDCVPFDPEWHRMARGGEDPAANIGIRLVYGIAKEIDYRSLLGLNVLTVIL